MANLFRCGGGSSKVEETTSIVFPNINLSFNTGGNVNSDIRVPDGVKTVKIGSASTTPYGVEGTIKISAGNVVRTITTFGSSGGTPCTIDTSQYDSSILMIEVSQSTSSNPIGGATLRNVEFIF